MHLVEKIDDIGRPAWIALMVLGFIIWWPIGLAVLGFLLGSRRMGCGHRGSWGAWQQARWGRARGCWHRGHSGGEGRHGSGNSAFDEYRQETLRRLEDEQNEFTQYLNNLRHAKDKAEFEQFMAERRNKQSTPPAPPTPSLDQQS